ncbi:hypothetical protein H6G25_18980 [Dolichospermum sp. FACHB-1091]|uniref:hypothetical protein n=1 Tax=Dolichospermum sp. FACHB-1091 TaxID=2692798 RepID=UPI0016809178|nr:hypothetical protein [Dolichospermum sp. FACHB-1091]MBD2445225.1 hypothetical protein [Dolichospermum sp. FACHB-1091]
MKLKIEIEQEEFVAGAIAGSAVTVIATGQAETIASSVVVANILSLISTATAMVETSVAVIAPLTAVAGSFVSAPVIIPVAATLAVGAVGGYVASQVVSNLSDSHSQNVN